MKESEGELKRAKKESGGVLIFSHGKFSPTAMQKKKLCHLMFHKYSRGVDTFATGIGYRGDAKSRGLKEKGDEGAWEWWTRD